MLELARAGSVPPARLRGVMAGIRDVLHDAAAWPVVSLDGDGQFDTALERVRKHLRETRATRILVGAANDPSALGAARAFQEAGRSDVCAIVGQNAEPDARRVARRRQSLIASVGLLSGALWRRRHQARDRSARAACRTACDLRQASARHAGNVDHLYPNDALLGVEPFARF